MVGALFRVVMGGREVVAEEVTVLPLATGWRTEADRPRPKTPEMGLLRDTGALLSSLLLTAVEAARVRWDVLDAVDEGPLRGSLLGDMVRPLLWLSETESVFVFVLWLNSLAAGFRRDRDRDNVDDMSAMRSYTRMLGCGDGI